MYRLELEIPGLPKTTNALRHAGGHWARHKHDKGWKNTVAVSCIGKKPAAPLSQFKLVLERHSSVEPDYDGLVSTFKCVVDSLREVGVIADDKYSATGQWDCKWFKTSPKKGYIRVIVEGLA